MMSQLYNVTLIYLLEAVRIGTVILCSFCNACLVYRYFHSLFPSEEKMALGEYVAYALYFLTIAASFLLYPQTAAVYLIPLLFLCVLAQIYPGGKKQNLFNALIFGFVMAFLFGGMTCISRSLSAHSLFWTVNREILSQVFATVFLFLFVTISGQYRGVHYHVKLPLFYWGMLLVTPCTTFVLSLYIAGRSLMEPLSAALFYFFFLLINISSFYLYDKMTAYFSAKTEHDILLRQNQYYSRLAETLTRSAETINGLRHDLKNHAIAMDSLIKTGNYDSLHHYLHETFTSALEEDNLFVTGNAVIDGLLSAKAEEARSLGIRLNSEIAVPSPLKLSPQLLTVILGNLLDNAVEAVSGGGVQKEISLRLVYEKSCVFLEISNPCQKLPYRRGGRFFSTKEDFASHGYGLRNVAKAVEDNGGAMKILMEDGRFVVHIVLYDV